MTSLDPFPCQFNPVFLPMILSSVSSILFLFHDLFLCQFNLVLVPCHWGCEDDDVCSGCGENVDNENKEVKIYM